MKMITMNRKLFQIGRKKRKNQPFSKKYRKWLIFAFYCLDPDVTVYRVEDMHCSHCEATVVRAVEDLPGVEKAKASASANTLTIKGPATEETIRTAVEGIGYTFKGKA